jgi:DNA-directed RNA polymerase subunit omega
VLVARVTTEDCLEKLGNHFALVMLASERARQLAAGVKPLVICHNRPAVTSLREIALGLVGLREPLAIALDAHLAQQRALERERSGSPDRARRRR